jgi:hypothetical protein
VSEVLSKKGVHAAAVTTVTVTRLLYSVATYTYGLPLLLVLLQVAVHAKTSA